MTPHVHCLTDRIGSQGKFISGVWTRNPLKVAKELGDIVPVLSVLWSLGVESLGVESGSKTSGNKGSFVSMEFCCPSAIVRGPSTLAKVCTF